MGNKLSRTLPGDPNIQQLSRFTQAARYIHVALLAAYSYDWLATLPDEIELIWRAGTSVFKFIILGCRYAGLSVSILYVLSPHFSWSEEQCTIITRLLAASCAISLILSCAILDMRALTLCSFDRWTCVVVGIVAIVQVVPVIYEKSQWIAFSMPPGIFGCFMRFKTNQQSFVLLYYIPHLFADLVLFSLTSYKAYSLWRDSKGAPTLSSVLLRDGIMYYAAVLTLNLIATILFLQKRWTSGIVLGPVSFIGTSILAFRLALNIRSTARTLATPSLTVEQSSETIEDMLSRVCATQVTNP